MNEFDRMASRKNEAKERKKKTLLIGIGVCIVVIIMLAVMIMYYQNVDAHTFKLYIDDQQVEFSEGFYITNESGETYVRAKDIANYIGWTYQNGEYGSYTEDVNSGYIQNEYEASSFVAGSNTLKKYIDVTALPYTDEETGEEVQPFEANSPSGTLEVSTLEIPVISQDGQIYFPLKHLNDICDCLVNYENPYRMYIYEQKFLINTAQANAAEFGYQNISGIYENMRLLSYGMMVVNNGSLYGVVNLYNNQSIIGMKYTDMVFAQNTKEFFVKTLSSGEESVGIINIQGGQVVPPRNYSNISVLSGDLGLYLVEKDGEYGVLDKFGEIILHCEYDSIGMPESLLTEFQYSVEDNKYLLFDEAIVVEDNGYYGLYSIEGDKLFDPTSYTGFGYIVENDSEAARNSEDVLTIEIDSLKFSDGKTRDIKAIVINQETDSGTQYHIYDIESRKLILASAERIYGITSRGVTKYYIQFPQKDADNLEELLAKHPEAFEN